MTIDYSPKGVCSKAFRIEVENDIIQSIHVTGGCAGNLMGISHLLEGMPVQEAISRMEGITCGARPTSCPDQISLALKTANSDTL